MTSQLARAIRRFGIAHAGAVDSAVLGLERLNETLLGNRGYRHPEPRLMGSAEDDPVVWWERDDELARWHARRATSLMLGEPMTTIDVKPVTLRPHDHAVDCDTYRCEGTASNCSWEADGYVWECEPDHPHAFAAWRAEYVGDLDAAPWRRVQRRLRRRRPCFRPVLWGGRLEHRANRLERVLYGRTILNLPGDRQLQRRPAGISSLDERRKRSKPE